MHQVRCDAHWNCDTVGRSHVCSTKISYILHFSDFSPHLFYERIIIQGRPLLRATPATPRVILILCGGRQGHRSTAARRPLSGYIASEGGGPRDWGGGRGVTRTAGAGRFGRERGDGAGWCICEQRIDWLINIYNLIMIIYFLNYKMNITARGGGNS